MAVAFRSNSTYTPGTATASHAVSTPTGFQAGDLLIVALTNPVNASITPPAGWTEIVDQMTTVGFALDYNAYLAWKIADGTEGSSQTFTSTSSGRPAGGMFAFSGVDQTTPVNTSDKNQQTGSGIAYTTATITPSVDNCMVAVVLFGYKGSAGTLSFTPNASFTEQADIPNTANGAALEFQTLLQTTAAAVSGSGTASTTTDRFSVILAVAPAVAAASSIKTVEGIAKASVKTVEGIAIASVKSIEGIQ